MYTYIYRPIYSLKASSHSLPTPVARLHANLIRLHAFISLHSSPFSLRPFPLFPPSDFTLKYSVRKNCGDDIDKLCKKARVTDDAIDSIPVTTLQYAFGAGNVQGCLSDKYKLIHSPECKTEVMRNMRIVLKSFGMNRNLVKACQDDRTKFCKDVPAGGGRMMECIRDHYKLLSDACQKAEFAVVNKLHVLQGLAGNEVGGLRGAGSSTFAVTGPLAMIALVSLGILLSAAAITFLRRWRRGSKGYTVVTMDKSG